MIALPTIKPSHIITNVTTPILLSPSLDPPPFMAQSLRISPTTAILSGTPSGPSTSISVGHANEQITIPSHYIHHPALQHLIIKESPLPFATTSNGQIFKGSLLEVGGKLPPRLLHVVAIKSVHKTVLSRADAETRDIANRRLYRCVETWKRLIHPHIASIFSVVQTQEEPALIVPFFPRGNIMNHVQHRDPKGALRDKLRYAREIALGLEFLHKSDITHGNLHIDNVLINSEGKAMITDVGVDAALRIVLGLVHTLHPYYKWKAPEMLVADPMRLKYLREGEEVTWRIADPTKAGDIFSFGRTVHELFKPASPDEQITPNRYIRDLYQGRLLTESTRPAEIPFGVWELLLECCAVESRHRPDAPRVAGRLARVVILDT